MSHDHQLRESQENELKSTRFSAAVEMVGRVGATAVIWAMATGMFALSIPLVRETREPAFPLLVITAAVLSTFAVWLGGYRRERRRIAARRSAAELAATQKRLHELEDRLSNLETINGFERRLAAETAARQESGGQQLPPLWPEAVERKPVSGREWAHI